VSAVGFAPVFHGGDVNRTLAGGIEEEPVDAATETEVGARHLLARKAAKPPQI